MKLYLICGNAHHGKSTLGSLLQQAYEEIGTKACLLRITQPLYTLAQTYFGWDGREETKPRTLLQTLGIEIIAKKLNKPNLLLDHLEETIAILDSYFDVGIITDGRLKKEITYLKKHHDDITVIHVTRPHYDNGLTPIEKNHITETDLLDYQQYDYDIINSKKEELSYWVPKIIAQTKEEQK